MSHDRIDVHQHSVPPVWQKSMSSTGSWEIAVTSWTPDKAIEFMDSLQIKTGILSVTNPSVGGWKGQEKLDMARKINEYSADVMQKRPDRFGYFATIPLPDVDGALKEIAYALDVLKADGVVLMSNYEDTYLGAEQFEPVWAELNRREAVVFIHPSKPHINIIPELPIPLIDFPFDTTRTAAHLVVKGVMTRYTKMKVILSHAGGTLPYISYRLAELLQAGNPGVFTREGVLETFRNFYYDTALSGTPANLPCLLKFARPDRILFGSDFPYAPPVVGTSMTNMLDAYDGYAPGQLAAINRNNALALFPRLA